MLVYGDQMRARAPREAAAELARARGDRGRHDTSRRYHNLRMICSVHSSPQHCSSRAAAANLS